MTAVAGALPLTRLVLRREWLRIAVWAGVLAALMAAMIVSLDALYPTQADRDLYAGVTGTVANAVLNGPPVALHTRGGMALFEVGWYLACAVAVLSVSTVTRALRADEEAGRTELVRAAVVGRHAGLAAALSATAAAQIVVAGAVVAAMLSCGLPARGALAYGLGLLGVGVVFAAVAAVTAQVAEHSRAALGLAAAVLGVSFVLRAVGDAGSGTVSWLSPLGWAQAMRPFGAVRWWPAAISLAVAAGLGALAVVTESRRDFGAGMLRPRRGPAQAAAWLSGPVSLAVRMSRSAAVAWAVAMATAGAAFGVLAEEMDDIWASSGELGAVLGGAGDPVDAYLALVALLLGVAVAGFVVSTVLRLRGEQSSGHAELLLAGPVSRWRWAGGQLAVAVLGSVVVAGCAGLGLGVAHAIRSEDPAAIARLVVAVAGHLPAAWAVGALTVLVVGLTPAVSSIGWAVVAGCLVVALLGGVLDLPAWAVDASPFAHTPALPGGAVDAAAMAVLTCGAVVVAAPGLLGLRRRDLG